MDLRDILNYGLAIFGILLAIYFYLKTIEKKEPICLFKTYREIEKLSYSQVSNVKLFYKSTEVDRVFTTYLWLWNKGKKTIHNSDIPPQSSIRIVLDDEEQDLRILDYRILRSSRDEINFKVAPTDENVLFLTFDFLDYKDGAVIEIQHTGSYDTKVSAEGIILGAPNGIEIKSKKEPFDFLFGREEPVNTNKLKISEKKSMRLISFIFLVIFAVVFTTAYSIVFIYVSEPISSPKNNLIPFPIYILITFLFVVTSLGYVTWRNLRLPYPKTLGAK